MQSVGNQEPEREIRAGETPLVAKAREAAKVVYGDARLSTGERIIDHVEAVARMVCDIRNDEELVSAAYLGCLGLVKEKPEAWVADKFGKTIASLVKDDTTLHTVSDRARTKEREAAATSQPEVLRRMVLALCGDLRVVLPFLCSRMQSMRWLASHDTPEETRRMFGEQTLALYSPLANRLGIWQIKGDLEDLALRFTNPEAYARIERKLEGDNGERSEAMQEIVQRLRDMLAAEGIAAEVSGRVKHIYSIWKKMQTKNRRFDQLYDVRATRIIVGTVEECYRVLSLVQERFERVNKEFDDYIANPKPNGYRSLHTVVVTGANLPVEVQIRTREMHEKAELGVAAHWRYKEAGNSKGGSAAEAERVAWLRQLLAWRDDMVGTDGAPNADHPAETHVYALTPQGRVVELPVGATPIDFAYALHTEIGHRCRGAKVNGAMVPLTTRLQTGQTVEIQTAKEGGPSRDWLNPERGFVVSSRSKAKLRQYFNAQMIAQQTVEGRDRLGKELARLGKTAVKLEDLAKSLGFGTVEELCIAFAKDEISARMLEQVLNPQAPEPEEQPQVTRRKTSGPGGVLVAGVGSLLTQLARCCHPAPPDPIIGYVTRGRGVVVHRADCPNVLHLDEEGQNRLIDVEWGKQTDATYLVEVLILARDRLGLVKDIIEVVSKTQQNIVSMSSATDRKTGLVTMTLSVEVRGAVSLQRTLNQLMEVRGVDVARRK